MGRSGVGLIALACLVMTGADAAAECRPTALISGEPAIVQGLAERLAASGIAESLTSGCPAVRVRVERFGERLVLEVTDAFSRRGRREVRDVATAAALIESWTLLEIEEGALPELTISVASVDHLASVRATTATYRTGVAATFESSVGSDGSLWLGGSLAGCVRVGPMCLGGVVRGARDTHAAGATSGAARVHGDELGALATLELPRWLGGFVVSPGVGLGYGRLAIATTHLDMHMMPFSLGETSHAVRGDVHVMVSRSLGGRFALYADLHGDAALARTEITAGPRSFVRAAVGIRLEAP